MERFDMQNTLTNNFHHERCRNTQHRNTSCTNTSQYNNKIRDDFSRIKILALIRDKIDGSDNNTPQSNDITAKNNIDSYESILSDITNDVEFSNENLRLVDQIIISMGSKWLEPKKFGSLCRNVKSENVQVLDIDTELRLIQELRKMRHVNVVKIAKALKQISIFHNKNVEETIASAVSYVASEIREDCYMPVTKFNTEDSSMHHVRVASSNLKMALRESSKRIMDVVNGDSIELQESNNIIVPGKIMLTLDNVHNTATPQEYILSDIKNRTECLKELFINFDFIKTRLEHNDVDIDWNISSLRRARTNVCYLEKNLTMVESYLHNPCVDEQDNSECIILGKKDGLDTTLNTEKIKTSETQINTDKSNDLSENSIHALKERLKILSQLPLQDVAKSINKGKVRERAVELINQSEELDDNEERVMH